MTLCNITDWQCHCQPPETPCEGLAELRKAYAEWRALAERRKQELSFAEEGLANYAQENERLLASNLAFVSANKSLADKSMEDGEEIERLRAALERIEKSPYAAEFTDTDAEVVESQHAHILVLRGIAREARRASPQSGDQAPAGAQGNK